MQNTLDDMRKAPNLLLIVLKKQILLLLFYSF